MDAEPRVQIAVDHGGIAEFCRRNQVRRLAFFGSVLRDGFSPESDVDVLVEFLPEARVSLFDMARMQNELSVIVGRAVDLLTLEELSRYFRDDVAAEAVEEYVA